MSDAKAQEKLVARLRTVAKQDGNRVCADCTEKVFFVSCVRSSPPVLPHCVCRRTSPRASGRCAPGGLQMTHGWPARRVAQFPFQICLDFNTLVSAARPRPAPRAPPRRRVQRPRLCVGQSRMARTVASDTSAR